MTKHQNSVLPQDPRWLAISTNDKSADGTFFYAVKSTGVYCRPSCGARLPKIENVTFFNTTHEAEAAGYRACKRCKPNAMALEAEQAQMVAKLCQHIKTAEEEPSLDDLAAIAGMSSFHLHRVFKSITGITPKAYAMAHRADKLRHTLSHSPTVTEAIYNAGYNASAPFYAQSKNTLGMQPKTYRTGGAKEQIHFAIAESSLGAVLVAATAKGVCVISMSDNPQELIEDLQNRFPKAQLIGADEDFEQTVAQVIGFVEAPQKGLNLPLDIRGTAFQQQVWQALQSIPLGTTTTYTQVAQQMGAPKAVRAVASACAKNAIALAIPCHRVVRSDGSLSGYRWGVERKKELINRENKSSQMGDKEID